MSRPPFRAESARAGLEAELRLELHSEINRLMLWLFPSALTMLGLTFGAAFGAAKLS